MGAKKNPHSELGASALEAEPERRRCRQQNSKIQFVFFFFLPPSPPPIALFQPVAVIFAAATADFQVKMLVGVLFSYVTSTPHMCFLFYVKRIQILFKALITAVAAESGAF